MLHAVLQTRKVTWGLQRPGLRSRMHKQSTTNRHAYMQSHGQRHLMQSLIAAHTAIRSKSNHNSDHSSNFGYNMYSIALYRTHVHAIHLDVVHPNVLRPYGSEIITSARNIVSNKM